MKLIYGAKYSDDERRKFIPTIHANVMQTIHILIHQLGEYDLYDTITDTDNLNKLEETIVTTPINESICNLIKIFWNETNVKTLWSKRSEFQIVGESVLYFIEMIDTIASNTYIPTEGDILNSRVKTTGIVTEGYNIDGYQQHVDKE